MMCDDAAEKRRQVESGVCVRVHATAIVAAARARLLPDDGEAARVPTATVSSRSHSPPAPQSPLVAVGAPAWLSAPTIEAVAASTARVRERALSAVKGDQVFELMSGQAIDEASGLAHAMAAEVLAPDASGTSSERARRLSARHLPASLDAANYSQLYEALLIRAARTTLTLLPTPRLCFDLAAYWAHPLAASMLTHEHVGTLLRNGFLVLPAAFPPPMAAEAAIEARSLAGRDGDVGGSDGGNGGGDGGGGGDGSVGSVAGSCDGALSYVSTPRAHERSAWLLSSHEAPPRAPEPTPAGAPLPASLFGPSIAIEPTRHPALCGCVRGLRAVSARLEEISELRLAVPRGAILREVADAGSAAHGPANSGWPDTGCEVVCALVLGGGGAGGGDESVGVSAHGTRRVVRTPPCSLVFTLARQATCDILPTAATATPPPASRASSLWLALPIYSSSLRAAADGRMLGVSEEAMRSLQERLRGKGELEMQELQRQAGLRK